MKITVLKETLPGEARVALMPDSVKKLVALKSAVIVESNAGLGAARTDDDYREAGATVSPDRGELLESANVLVTVNRPPPEVFAELKPGAVVLGFLRPLDEPQALRPALAGGLTTFAMELIPRITRAQAMDALSSMATVAGYKAVVLGASQIPRMFPLLMTAAGTVPPARVLVLGAGVAGLQAIATARRLGAVVEGYDVRAAAGEQVRSLGATFLEVDLGGIKTEDAGGYAVELSEEAMQRGRDLIAERAKTADVVITTAQVPGRRAPLLVTEEAVNGMRRGAMIIDLAGATGGNCAISEADKIVERNGVTIMAPTNLAATVPVHASQLYSRNVTAFLSLLIKDGELSIDMTDDVVGPSCVTHQGEVVNSRVAAAVGASIRPG
ncbi:MAG TPA: NAD(P)(+) transhydrogenase (Re/Si-specific) subunit alpha [Blastocatellia bacterium]|jgi:NAD(P) transhydrogenase subunit alpha|nr:NAD(P)(+) transhydrogenase (Re/Si-specific) subunit alpha [Blastocatellia bacterium]HAF22930.1 NAD(P)(+) transhydrogenase (Re/Si-specific) subunit alpha [Blastocatellia bacterium]